MKILIIGLSGIEHALAWKLYQSEKVSKIYIAPGNVGTAVFGENIPISTIADIVSWLKVNKVDLVITGSASYLSKGLTDEIKKLNLPVFGPTRAAAQIEWSKSFAKTFMKNEGIPTAPFKIFNDIEKAKNYLDHQIYPLVIKADGLAYGLGTTIANNINEAQNILDDLMKKKIFGVSGETVIIEKFMEGSEISIHAFSDGDNIVLFPASLGYKRFLDGDKGPNTGGMGSIAPVPWVTPKIMEEIKDRIILPTIRGLKKINRPFVGILFPGVMLTRKGPIALEINARFGHPETQSYLRILKTDLVDILLACIDNNLRDISVEWRNQYACCVVAAAEGYPRKHKKGTKIDGLSSVAIDSDVVVFQSGTKKNGPDTVVNKWGLALGISAVGNSLDIAVQKAYASLKKIKFEGMRFRDDVGRKVNIPK